MAIVQRIRRRLGSQKKSQFIQSSIQNLRRNAEGLTQGDGKTSVFGGGIGIDSDEEVLRIENARLETKVFAAHDVQAQAACVTFRIDGNVEVPMLVD